jgi:hypothetical protein
VFLSTAASATLVQQTYTGIVTSGVDTGGIFGPAGTNLTGDPYKATFVFDTNISHCVPGCGSGEDFVRGGTFYGGLPSPMLSNVVTINGISFNLDETWDVTAAVENQSGAFSKNPSVFSTVIGEVRDHAGDELMSNIVNEHGEIPELLTGPFVYDLHGDDTSDGVIELGPGYGTDPLIELKATQVEVGTYLPLHVPLGSIPEPATLPLFATGLGLMALLIRRRRTNVGGQ